VKYSLYINHNESLCQDSVDDLIAACTIGGSIAITDNNGTCP
jgi:hypothetical protein